MNRQVIEFFKLSNAAKVVNIVECFSDNDGNFIKMYILDNDEVLVKEIKGNHPLMKYEAAFIEASQEEIETANEIFINSAQDKAYRHHLGCNTFIGCTVILQRSKVAPNKIPLKVVGFTESYFNQFGHRVPDQIVVTDGEEFWRVSVNCIKTVTRGLGFL